MTNLLQETHTKSITKKVPVVKPGYTVEVDTIIREEKKQRIQKFRGLVIAVTGIGANEMITVRKISSGVGVEKKLPVHSPNVGAIKVIKTEPTRRSKLYFMRERVGKNAMRIKKGKAIFMTDADRAALEAIDSPEEIVNEELVMDSVEVASAQDTVEAEVVNTAVDPEIVAKTTAEEVKA